MGGEGLSDFCGATGESGRFKVWDYCCGVHSPAYFDLEGADFRSDIHGRDRPRSRLGLEKIYHAKWIASAENRARGAASGRPPFVCGYPLTFYQLTSCSKYCLTRATRCIVPEGGALFLGTAITPPSFDIARYSNPKACTFAPRKSPRAGFFCQKQMSIASHPFIKRSRH